jgi:type II secretory pathway pseudopilin PulG
MKIMKSHKQKTAGFTIVEVVIAASLMVVTITIAMSVVVYVLSEAQKANKQTELDIEVQIAMERLKRDLRLSTLDRMFYSPEGQGPYSALSFPLAEDSNGDGILDVDANGALVWSKQVVYHIKTGTPDELRVTTFSNRDNSLTGAERQEQLGYVATNGLGVGTYNGVNASSVTLFANLFDWELAPLDAVFDGYDSAPSRAVKTLLGSISLTNGTHTLRFEAVDKNDASSGYRIGVDSLFASPSYSLREGEDHLPVSGEAGATASNRYVASGSWSGNHDLDFKAVAISNYVELTFYNDLWKETNFGATGETRDDTEVEFDRSLDPFDVVLRLSGNETNWTVESQTGALTSYSGASNMLSGAAVRVLVRGSEMVSGNWIQTSGAKCSVAFMSGDGMLGIRDAYIAEASSFESNTIDAASSTMTRLRFSGNDSINISANTTEWSDLTDFEIDEAKSYLISYLVRNDPNRGSPTIWDETHSPFYGTFMIPASSTPLAADTSADTWSTRGDVLSFTNTPAVAAMYVSYVTNGYYTSRIFDTQADAPSYDQITWSSVTPSDSSIDFRVRTAADSLMTNATAWSSITAITSPGSIASLADERYVQFRASLKADTSTLETPLLKDVTIDWPGQEQFVDIGGTFSMGPDYGIFELTVDGQDIKKGLQVDLEIYDYVRAHGSSNRITSRLVAEVFPRNTGK